MVVATVQEMVPEGDHEYYAPFLIVDHRVRDIGLVGWANNRWTHQDKAQRCKPVSSAAASGKITAAPANQTAWKQAFDPDSCKYYFYNSFEGVTSWEAPSEPFTADETVEYYVRLGIAQPWLHASSRRGEQPIECIHTTPQGSASTISDALGHSNIPQVETDKVAPLSPAHVRFSPCKKGDLPKDVERYWVLRYSLFSRWSHGVVLNEKSLFSVTPEVIAKHHAAMLRGGASVLDAFCGCGGNTIQFAATFEKVLACEIDHEQICMAMRNCEVYGVAQGITWIHGDVFEAHLEPVDVVFLSPPWGGPGINGSTGFDATIPIQGLGRSVRECIAFACTCLSTRSLAQQVPAAKETPNLAVYLPRNTSVSSLVECIDVPGYRIVPLCLERNALNGKLKSATLYCHVTSL